MSLQSFLVFCHFVPYYLLLSLSSRKSQLYFGISLLPLSNRRFTHSEYFSQCPKGRRLSPVHQCQLRACIPLTSSHGTVWLGSSLSLSISFSAFAFHPLWGIEKCAIYFLPWTTRYVFGTLCIIGLDIVNSSGNEKPTRRALIYLTFPAYRGKSAWKSCEHFPLWCRFYWTLLKHKKKDGNANAKTQFVPFVKRRFVSL